MAEPLTFATAEAFEAWLLEHGGLKTEVWLRLAKKSAAEQTLTYAQALDVSICHGWIDGVKKPDSAQHFLQRFTPRKPKSRWSAINRSKAQALIAQGRMGMAGQAAIDEAKANGTWESAYAGSASISVPEDLAAALGRNKAAEKFFATVSRQNRYAILYRIGAVKKPETRARKIAEFVSMLAQGKTIYP